MTPEQEQEYLEKYKQAKASGVKFWPDIIFKDLLVAFSLFLLLILLATFVGVKPEPPADPSDSSYIPRPEWYFLFMFQTLRILPAHIAGLEGEVVGVTLFALAGLVLLLVPFLDRWAQRERSHPLVSALGAAAFAFALLMTALALVKEM